MTTGPSRANLFTIALLPGGRVLAWLLLGAVLANATRASAQESPGSNQPATSCSL